MRDAFPKLDRALKLAPGEPALWDLLGFCHARMGSLEQSSASHCKALPLSGDAPAVELFLNFFSSLRLLKRLDLGEEVLRRGLNRYPGHYRLAIEQAGIFTAYGRLDLARNTLEASLAASPGNPDLLFELGFNYERTNRLDEFDALVSRIGDPGDIPQLNLLKAWHLRRIGRLPEAAAILPKCNVPRAQAQVEQMKAELAEQEDRIAEAFAHFAAMKANILAQSIERDTDSYRTKVIEATRAMRSRSKSATAFEGRMPAFVVGSPRSGTTLLDTLLGGHPDVVVAEELPMRERIEEEFPGLESSTDNDRVEAARRRYFEIAELACGPIGERLLVDKHPLHTATIPLLDRLFPGAPIVLVERHPCAVTLSCFTTPFQSNRSMRSYSTLEGSALTYDALFGSFARARELLPLNVHEIRYERMIV
ncbi:MAG: sulfotransferase, partial [Novosphingobium sp.]